MRFDLELPTLSGIKIIGIGGAGVNILKKFQDFPLPEIELLAIDSSKRTLDNISTPYKIGLENNEKRSKIKDELFPYLENSKLIFLISGLGGETGSIYTPLITDILKDFGTLSVAVLVFPFHFEGKRREKKAKEVKEEILGNVDALFPFQNDSFYEEFPNLPISEFISSVNLTIYNAIKSILEPFLYPSLTNIEISSLYKFVEGAGEVMIGSGEEKGEKRATRVIEKGLSSMTWKKEETKKIRRLLISIIGGDDLTIHEVGKTCETITYRIHPEAEIAVGAVTRKDFKGIIKATFYGVKSVGAGFRGKPATEERRTLW